MKIFINTSVSVAHNLMTSGTALGLSSKVTCVRHKNKVTNRHGGHSCDCVVLTKMVAWGGCRSGDKIILLFVTVLFFKSLSAI